ncbi:MAG: hypothetical protein GTO45_07780, partial [Candidatus Aminicenantes bacterium]|nr:hypothetical protein [Candidatus Aminicenantes bacterium]NIM78729.1 hypothetical protein [Candidatus Aminicenantes bacterium]NIN17984.1 hypothetical protein [Candidatus Aminicenantes bacterium]NIN41884.1 hypothetical protein [Candidatus Aminicenantes bacterium]NIN84639.1 hypothetical protein [Candidatus Aminicenantes bacterium]
IGYSGCDDFDIIPIILNTKSDRKIIWLEYSPGLDVVVNGREIVKSTDKFGRVGFIFSELIRRGQREIENCYIVKTDANIFLKSIINVFNNSYEDPEIAQFEYQINSDTYFLNKFKKIFPNLNHILKMKAILYFIIEDYTNSLKNYSKILSNIEKEKNLKFKSSVFHEVAYCYINLAIPDYDNAIKYSMKSFEIDVENKFVSILLSADQFASLLFKVGKIKDSLDVYKSIISSKLDLNSYFLKYQFATLLNNYAIHLNQLGKMDDSIKTAEKSAELFKNIGDLNGLVNSTLTITTPLMELGYIDKAMVKLRDLEKIIKDLGSLFSLCVLYNELGITYRLKKEFDES